MASRYERAASLVKNAQDTWGGDDSGNYNVVIGLMHCAHRADKEGWTVERLLDEMTTYVEGSYVHDSVKFDDDDTDESEELEPRTSV